MRAVPDSGGTSLLVSAGGAGELAGTVYANVDFGPGHNKGGYTMTYSDTADTYIAVVPGFIPGVTTYSSLSITTTALGEIVSTNFYRTYVPPASLTPIVSLDGLLRLQPVSLDTFDAATYVVVVPSPAPPGPVPAGHRCTSLSYAVRASGAIAAANRPLNLEIVYPPLTLSGADPHTLALFAWDPVAGRWDNLGGQLFYDPDRPSDPARNFVSAATARFTTYALLATTTWRDAFSTLSGLDPALTRNVQIEASGDSGALALAQSPGGGVAVSRPIRPHTPIARWGVLNFAGASVLPATALTVDVLSEDGTLLMADVASGTNLGAIDPLRYPALRLRASLTSTEAGRTPVLDGWQVTWEVGERVYLPVLGN